MSTWYVSYKEKDLLHYGTKGHSGVYARTPKVNSAEDYTHPYSREKKTPTTKTMVSYAKKDASKKIYEMIRRKNAKKGKVYLKANPRILGVQITGIDKKTGTFTYKIHYKYNDNDITSIQNYVEGKLKFR